MNGGEVALQGLKIGGALAAVGAILGTIVGVLGEKKRLHKKDAMKMALPPGVAQTDALREGIMAMSNIRHADIEKLKRVARRCEAMLQLYSKVSRADPRTVHIGIVTAGRQIDDSMRKYLKEFHKASKVSLMRIEGAGLQPVSPDLRAAQQLLLTTMAGYIHNLTMMVKSKQEQAAAMAV